MGDLVFRHESKHMLTFSEYLGVQSRLRAVAVQDRNAGAGGTYFIRSLYFDNYNDKALKEKIYGINERSKFRIRCYNNDFSVIRLEKKSKINGLCNKQSALLTRNETKKIIDGDFEFLKEKEDALCIELYAAMKSELLRPKVLVDYTREPYVYAPGNVRVTFDRNIRSGLRQQDFFHENLPGVGAQAESGVLMEVKYDAFLPEIISMCIQVNERVMQAFSKYAACRRFD